MIRALASLCVLILLAGVGLIWRAWPPLPAPEWNVWTADEIHSHSWRLLAVKSFPGTFTKGTIYTGEILLSEDGKCRLGDGPWYATASDGWCYAKDAPNYAAPSEPKDKP